MSNLTQVRQALETNRKIVVIGAPEVNYLPSTSSNWAHTVDFYVAPRKRGLYTAEKLQELMMELIPDLNPSAVDEFRDYGDSMSFGKLYFDETIGTASVRRDLTLTDTDMFHSEGFFGGKRVIESSHELRRRTWVRLFPNVVIAADALGGENQYSMKKKELIRYRGIFARMRHFFF